MTEWLESQGKLTDCEFEYRQALKSNNDHLIDIRHGLIQLLWLEGRLNEASELIETNWLANNQSKGPIDGSTLSNLRARLSIEFEVYPVDHVRKRLMSIYEKEPEDAGVKLGFVNLLLKNGQFDDAETIYNSIKKAPFPEIQNAIDFSGLMIELQNKQLDSSAIALYDNLIIDLPTAVRIISLLQNKLQRNQETDAILHESYRLFPSSAETIESLNYNYLQDGKRDEAEQLRKLREKLDQTRRDYANLVGSDLRQNPEKMAEMAEQLGRWFEAYAFRSMVRHQNLNSRSIDTASDQRFLDLAESSRKKIPFLQLFKSNRFIASNSSSTGIATAGNDLIIPNFEDVTSISGINFVFESGRTPKHQLPETMSGGLAMLDYDNDGFQDLLLLQGGAFPYVRNDQKSGSGDRLYRNLGDGHFLDVTAAAGFPDQSIGYSHGVTIGDINNDSYDDVFITRFGEYQIWINNGNGTFENQTNNWFTKSDRGWPTSAAFADFDKDGDLDLYVCHYVDWDPLNPRLCGNEKGGQIQYCVPHLLKAQKDHIFRNDGGKFTDISELSGIHAADLDGRGLGVITADFNEDGQMDLFVANDGTANFLFINKGDFKFTNEAFTAGVAANSDGGFQAGMGVSCGDFNGDLLPDIIVTNFYGESTSYFESMGQGLFRERSAAISLKEQTRYRLGFGTILEDFNNDGQLDLLTANGHVNDVRPVIPYQMPPQLLLGQQGKTFVDPGQKPGPIFEMKLLGRGLVSGDINNDGLMDAVQTNLDS